MPSAVVGRQCPALSPAKNTPSSVGRAHLVRDPVALVARRRRAPRSPASRTVGSLTWSRGSNEPTPTRSSSPRGEAPRVAGAHVLADRATARGPRRCRAGGPPGRATAAHSGGWIGLGAVERTRRQPSASTISGAVRSPRSVVTQTAHRGPLTVAVSNSTSGALRAQQRAQLAVVEGRERPWQTPAEALQRGVEDEVGEGLADRALQAERIEPRRGRGAGAGLALADLVAVDHQHACAGSGQLTADGQSGEARTADDHVPIRA